ncbi:MAG: serine O-acetyltransferase [Erysipelotrichaceae bacterium]|jgi:serine O-acetyltransferase
MRFTLSPKNNKYKEMIEYDYNFLYEFKNHRVSKEYLNGYEWKVTKAYRLLQANQDTIWKKYLEWKLHRLELKTGISFENNMTIGKGLIIGHWGSIVLNGKATFGNHFFLTHNVTIGRDIRGKRKGVPTFGDRVVVRTNSTVVGNIKIGNDVLIAPNTFVNFDVPDHSIVIGNPAKIFHRENATEGHLPEMKL